MPIYIKLLAVMVLTQFTGIALSLYYFINPFDFPSHLQKEGLDLSLWVYLIGFALLLVAQIVKKIKKEEL